MLPRTRAVLAASALRAVAKDSRCATKTSRQLGEVASARERVNRAPEPIELSYDDRALSTASDNFEAALKFHQTAGASELTLWVDADEFARPDAI